MSSPTWNLSKNIGRYVENTNKKCSFLLWQICQFNHYGWLILLKFYWFLNSNSQNLLLARFLIRPILDPKFLLMVVKARQWRYLLYFNWLTLACIVYQVQSKSYLWRVTCRIKEYKTCIALCLWNLWNVDSSVGIWTCTLR